jgi:hypothetical protein
VRIASFDLKKSLTKSLGTCANETEERTPAHFTRFSRVRRMSSRSIFTDMILGNYNAATT